MSEKTRIRQQIRNHWESHDRERDSRPDRVNWWQSKMIREHINKVVCGRLHSAPSGGLMLRAKELLGDRVLDTGISVGCAAGHKEMRLIQHGVVRRFVLYELSAERVRRGQDAAADRGLSEAVTFHNEDPFEIDIKQRFDLVHWNNALHHMLDVDAAVRWSREILRPGGLFLMDDYVGPARFQWSDAALNLANSVRLELPERLLANPFYPTSGKALLSRKVRRPNARKLAREDPSEAAQSDKIIESVKKYFPAAETIPTGGVIYQLALSHVIHNIDEGDDNDRALLSDLLMIDENALSRPDIPTHYATSIAFC